MSGLSRVPTPRLQKLVNMSLFSNLWQFCTLKLFRSDLADPAYPLSHRMAEHGIKRLTVMQIGENHKIQSYVRSGKEWDPIDGRTEGDPGLVLLTSSTFRAEIRELPVTGASAKEDILALTVAERGSSLLKSVNYDPTQRYQLLPIHGSKFFFISSIQDTEVKRAEAECHRHSLKVIRIVCGVTQILKVALAELESKKSSAHLLIVNDQNLTVIVPLHSGRANFTKEDDMTFVSTRADSSTEVTELTSLISTKAHAIAGNDSPIIELYTTSGALLSPQHSLAATDCHVEEHNISPALLCLS